MQLNDSLDDPSKMRLDHYCNLNECIDAKYFNYLGMDGFITNFQVDSYGQVFGLTLWQPLVAQILGCIVEIHRDHKQVLKKEYNVQKHYDERMNRTNLCFHWLIPKW